MANVDFFLVSAPGPGPGPGPRVSFKTHQEVFSSPPVRPRDFRAGHSPWTAAGLYLHLPPLPSFSGLHQGSGLPDHLFC